MDDPHREGPPGIGRQLRATGIRQVFSPVMDVARNARWGRVHETYGEDVYLTTAMSVAFVAARAADVAIAAIGGRGGWFGTRITEGEGTDIARVELAGPQADLVRAVAATGTPLVGVVFQGRPYALTEVDDLVGALAVVYYPGPHGHGLSYTTFEYGEVTASSDQVPADGGRVQIAVPVRNAGARYGCEVVQLYASVSATGITRPARQLAGFRRVPLEAGEQAVVTFDIAASQLGYSGADGRFTLLPGTVTFAAGASSADLRGAVTVAITGPAADLEGRRSYLSTSAVASEVTA